MLLECMIITEDQNLKYTITSSLLKPLCSSAKLGWCRVMGGGAAHQMAHMAKVLRVILYTSPRTMAPVEGGAGLCGLGLPQHSFWTASPG